MPFVSKAQRRACWAQYNKAKKAGKVPKWNCKEWEKETKEDLPEKASMLGGKLPEPQLILLMKQDLQTFTSEELDLLAKYQQIPTYINRSDKCWIIAINNFLDKR